MLVSMAYVEALIRCEVGVECMYEELKIACHEWGKGWQAEEGRNDVTFWTLHRRCYVFHP